ncbi:hypothetical protein BD309DRAFT_867362 [Dichomitus squalens]|uniref:NADH-ubiquinone oxidoreductase 14 kDa subunit n=1 Tax=Dichomitus squalens TaxID=114155 RepID=A0A4Q9Q5S9_9APHY|nr:uncharacterized protein DICSQDRAFT_51978 [Dichomitus squalens LYAD-421 SS1]EJF64899.1 hypothetical protein DICSQDRAFT_51978 [Dichomitus squalens LYAD-421 SS1]TBU33342.1 hypothetical protein BD311DRAFT_652160 [Dichomitus squalens]TBU41937.1 hypothetical protein BD309DRAFT_867362 [Dichomitus squalens]TBU62732.1 hypothetical protein BD310DRAFT_810373 [Dichomitus squalens]
MSLLANIVGFSLVGIAARMGQLGIQKRPILENPIGHAIAAGTFGFAGYWAYQWDRRAAVLLAEKRAEIAARRAKTDAPAS